MQASSPVKPNLQDPTQDLDVLCKCSRLVRSAKISLLRYLFSTIDHAAGEIFSWCQFSH